MGSGEGRFQNLRDFTVQIRHAETDAIVGTGVVVSPDGKIVTCAHVVLAAGVNPRTGRHIPSAWKMALESIWGKQPDARNADLGVYFPQARGGEVKARRATVAACLPQHDDDMVLLQLVDGSVPLGPEQIAVLGTAEPSEGHPFRSYGYAPLGLYPAGFAGGTILGCVECPEASRLLAGPVQLESSQIAPGMSGSAVLDTERNLVVGLVAETYFPDQTTKHRDTAWAVNARVLTFPPFNFDLRDESLPLRAAPQPKTDVAAARAAVAPDLDVAWNNAPPSLTEWVGRDDLLADITADWADPARHVTGLIGFGGEGKSSLARKWVDTLLANDSPLPTGDPLKGAGGPGVRENRAPTPNGVFWWGFYERPSADEFFEAALAWLSGGSVDPRQIPSSSAKAAFIAGMLTKGGHYLFVLDGLEVMQHQEGDQYGLLRSADLREFLGYFAAPGHASFCLVTSRAPLLDLVDYPSYTHRDVERLSPADGRALLRRLGVTGPDAALDGVVTAWDGHALTLGLLGGLLTERYGGDVSHISDLPAPIAGEPRYERVHRVLRRYDEHLTDAERAFLTLFSAFRTPVTRKALEQVFWAKGKPWSPQALNTSIAALDGSAFVALVKRLVDYRILRGDPQAHTYTAHPLVRAHYFARLTAGECTQTQDAHARIKDYYLSVAGDTPQYPTLDDLRPLIEVVHHACQAGAYDEAWRVYWERIQQRDRFALTQKLGAWETDLALMPEFFPGGDATQEPRVSDPNAKRWILNEIGLCLMSLGRLGEAVPFYERANVIQLGLEDWHNASLTYRNLADLHAYVGALAASADAAGEALRLARRAENKADECYSLAYQAWAAHLRGELEAAGAAFGQAETLERKIDPNERYLYSLRGIQHADHLRRAGDADYARRVTQANLEICEQYRVVKDLSLCHRVLGDLDADAGQHQGARTHYDQALQIARSISHRHSLIEGLLARGRWAARQSILAKVPNLRKDEAVGLAFNDLNEALGYALAGGYRRYEADIRIALAWAHLAAASLPLPEGDPLKGAGGTRVRVESLRQAQQEADRARQMSAEMGYHWGQVDAAEVLAALGTK